MSALRLGIACLVFATAVSGLGPGTSGGGEEPAKGAAQFAGQWFIDSFEADGVKNDGAEAGSPFPPDMNRMTVRGDRIEFVFVTLASGTREEGTFSIVEAGANRFKVDVNVTERRGSDLGKQPDRKFVREELWRLTASGRLQRCFPADPSKKRPETFATKKGDGNMLLTFERRRE